jgi:hypothetical protein
VTFGEKGYSIKIKELSFRWNEADGESDWRGEQQPGSLELMIMSDEKTVKPAMVGAPIRSGGGIGVHCSDALLISHKPGDGIQYVVFARLCRHRDFKSGGGALCVEGRKTTTSFSRKRCNVRSMVSVVSLLMWTVFVHVLIAGN